MVQSCHHRAPAAQIAVSYNKRYTGPALPEMPPTECQVASVPCLRKNGHSSSASDPSTMCTWLTQTPRQQVFHVASRLMRASRNRNRLLAGTPEHSQNRCMSGGRCLLHLGLVLCRTTAVHHAIIPCPCSTRNGMCLSCPAVHAMVCLSCPALHAMVCLLCPAIHAMVCLL